MPNLTPTEARRRLIAGDLPPNTTVTGSLYLSGASITALPEGLSVGGWLDLSGDDGRIYPVRITCDGLKIGCEDHPLETWEALDDRAAAAMDGKRAVMWWRKWGAEVLRWRAAVAARGDLPEQSEAA